MRFEFFGFDDMKKMTQSGRLLSGKQQSTALRHLLHIIKTKKFKPHI
jgi:hypothetical protein